MMPRNISSRFNHQHPPKSVNRSRDLRRMSPLAERILWSRLRGRQGSGYKFRRQHPVGPYFADFCCIECAAKCNPAICSRRAIRDPHLTSPSSARSSQGEGRMRRLRMGAPANIVAKRTACDSNPGRA